MDGKCILYDITKHYFHWKIPYRHHKHIVTPAIPATDDCSNEIYGETLQQ